MQDCLLIPNFVGMEEITWNDFEKVELRAGTILEVLDYPEARKPAYKVKVDFGDFGVKDEQCADYSTLYKGRACWQAGCRRRKFSKETDREVYVGVFSYRFC